MRWFRSPWGMVVRLFAFLIISVGIQYLLAGWMRGFSDGWQIVAIAIACYGFAVLWFLDVCLEMLGDARKFFLRRRRK